MENKIYSYKKLSHSSDILKIFMMCHNINYYL